MPCLPLRVATSKELENRLSPATHKYGYDVVLGFVLSVTKIPFHPHKNSLKLLYPLYRGRNRGLKEKKLSTITC